MSQKHSVATGNREPLKKTKRLNGEESNGARNAFLKVLKMSSNFSDIQLASART